MRWMLLLLLFVVGCQGDAICADLNPVATDACCSDLHAGEMGILCVGSWEHSTEDGCYFVCDSSVEPVVACDALHPCPVGECLVAPGDVNPTCYEGNPCDLCWSGECLVAESYPMQVYCL